MSDHLPIHAGAEPVGALLGGATPRLILLPMPACENYLMERRLKNISQQPYAAETLRRAAALE